MRARNPLYVMAKPPPEVQAQIAALPRNDAGRSPDLLHVTLISLYDLHYAPPEWLPATIAALGSFAAAPFPLRFDRIENRKAVTLRTREPLAGARADSGGFGMECGRLFYRHPGLDPGPRVTGVAVWGSGS